MPAHAVSPVTLEGMCRMVGTRLQSVGVQQCLNSGLHLSDGISVNGLPLVVRDYLPTAHRAFPRRILLIGGIHGDELTSVSVVFRWMQRIERERFQPFHWRVLPATNPDGLLVRPSTRTNARGVDLNRNFPSENWAVEAKDYWERRTGRDPRRFPGTGPGSEPESRWIAHQIADFQPDAIVSVHAPFGVLDFDGPQDPPTQFGYLRLNQLGTYPGSLGNYAGLKLGIPVITLELPHAGIMPTPQQSSRIWTDMLTWLDQKLPEEAPPQTDRLERLPWDQLPWHMLDATPGPVAPSETP